MSSFYSSRHERSSIECSVEFFLDLSSQELFDGFIENISESGFCLITEKYLDLGQEITISTVRINWKIRWSFIISSLVLGNKWKSLGHKILLIEHYSYPECLQGHQILLHVLFRLFVKIGDDSKRELLLCRLGGRYATGLDAQRILWPFLNHRLCFSWNSPATIRYSRSLHPGK